jgi:O-antigen/teichoic acid export membrane protein
MSKLKKRIFLNTIASAFQKIVKIGEQLVLIPFFIKFWGADYYGEWLTITTIPTFLAFSDLGFGTSTANTFILSYSSGKRLEAANILKTGLRLMSLMTVALIIISYGILFLIERTSVLNDINIPADEAVVAIFLLLVSRVVYFYYGVFDSFFRVSNKAHVSINFRSVVSFVNIAVAIVILITGGKVVALAFGSLVINLVAVPIYMFWANRILDLEERKLAVIVLLLRKFFLGRG